MEKENKETKLWGTKKELLDYECDWCHFMFKQWVCKSGKQGNGKRGNVSDQVKCPMCQNFIKTWK